MRRIVTLAAAAMALFSQPAEGQTRPRVEVGAGVERLTYTYRFENESSFDTQGLVPHFFEQHYERTAPAVEARIHYALASRRMSTRIAFTPEREASGSDFDTFFQPDGDIATSGTGGGVDLATFGIGQTIGLVTRPSFLAGVTFDWRRDRADFHPADRVVTHTLPPSETREFITDRERTVSQTFAVGVEGTWRRASGSPWRTSVTGRVVPSLRARLLTQLPDKYPGRDIVFTAAGWSVGGRAELSRANGGVWIALERAGSYRSSARFTRTVLSAGGSIAF